MNFRPWWPALAVACLLVTPVYAFDATVPEGPEVTVKTVTQGIPTLPQYTQVEIPLYDQATELSHGRIKFNHTTRAEAGVAEPDMLRFINQGQADIGAQSLASIAGDVPFLEMVDLAGLSPTSEQARKVAAAARPEINAQLERFGIKMIASYAFPASILFCKPDVKSLADLKGLKVRTFGPSQNDLVTQLGAQPVSIGFPDVYEALARGVADCAITAPLSANSAKWFEVTNAMYAIPLAWGTGGYFVNLAWWNGLDPDVQTFLTKLYDAVEDGEWKLVDTGWADGIACNMGEADKCSIGTLAKGDEVMSETGPSDADLATVKDILKSTVLPAWIKRCGSATCGEQFNKLVAPVVGFEAE